MGKVYQIITAIILAKMNRHSPLFVPGGIACSDDGILLPDREAITPDKGQNRVKQWLGPIGAGGKKIAIPSKLGVPQGKHFMGQAVVHEGVTARHRRPGPHHVQQ